MSKQSRKPAPQGDVPPMTDFEFDDVVSILMGVKPKSMQNADRQKYSRKSKKSD
ncbi:MAG: hypothetical protein OXI60_00010 [Acidiferrobacterales bacterium]|nr:hypothetical protein [Acidiferrobacterales bacterium]